MIRYTLQLMVFAKWIELLCEINWLCVQASSVIILIFGAWFEASSYGGSCKWFHFTLVMAYSSWARFGFNWNPFVCLHTPHSILHPSAVEVFLTQFQKGTSSPSMTLKAWIKAVFIKKPPPSHSWILFDPQKHFIKPITTALSFSITLHDTMRTRLYPWSILFSSWCCFSREV